MSDEQWRDDLRRNVERCREQLRVSLWEHVRFVDAEQGVNPTPESERQWTEVERIAQRYMLLKILLEVA